MESQLLTSGAFKALVAQPRMNEVGEAQPRACISVSLLLLGCSGCLHGHTVAADLHVPACCPAAVPQARLSAQAWEGGLRAAHVPMVGGTFTLRSS